MSKNRENVLWQSENGTWNRGFFSFWEVGDTSDPDFDDEWDVEYNYDEFFWASTGHTSEVAAEKAWRGPNPGGWERLVHTDADASDAARYDAMAAALNRR